MRILAAALLLAALPASALEVAGVKVAESLPVDGKTLVLNGAGVRTKTIFAVKVYVGALYVTQRSTDAAAIVALDAPKVLRLTLLRDVDKDDHALRLPRRHREQLARPVGGAGPEAEAGRDLVPAGVQGEAGPRRRLRPGQGTTIGVEGGKTITVEGKDFADALFRIWLGPKPTDGGLEDLKAALLSGK